LLIAKTIWFWNNGSETVARVPLVVLKIQNIHVISLNSLVCYIHIFPHA